jgi:glycine dehydrogenase subunit 1
MHPWIGAGASDKLSILDELGLEAIDDLFKSIPSEVCVDGVPLPKAQDEVSVRRDLEALAAANVSADHLPCFLGAGAYRHLQPSVVDAVLSRAEFFTSYTPYQPEISQGTLQVIFEFQTLIGQLTGCEVANASLYDGATALVEAVLFGHRVLRGKRDLVIVAETVHPMYRRVLETYTRAQGLELEVVAGGADGRIDPDRIRGADLDRACCVAIQVVTEAVSLGVLAGGGSLGFDVVCGEAQSFGVPLGFGGPHLGFFACAERNIRQMPGRLVGETADEDGQRAYCLTLSTREQHIRRSKATSNICTNQGLMALAATVWLELLGGSGLRTLAQANLARCEELKRRLTDVGGGWSLAYPDSPTFNEFLLASPAPADDLVHRLADAGVLAGVPSRRWGGSWPDGLLVAVTERNSTADLDALVDALVRQS